MTLIAAVNVHHAGVMIPAGQELPGPDDVWTEAVHADLLATGGARESDGTEPPA